MQSKVRPDEEVLRQRYQRDKQSLADIAKDFSVTSRTVCKWLTYYGIPTRMSVCRRRFKAITKHELETLYSEQMKTTVEIAEKFQTNHCTVLSLLRRHKIPIRSNSEAQRLHNGTMNITNAIISDLYKSGMSQGQIAQKFGITQTAVGMRVRGIGLSTEGRKANFGTANGMYGRTHTPEAVAKIVESNRRQFNDPRNRERAALRTCKQIQEGRTGKAYNKLETLIADQFTDEGIEFVQQYRLGRFLYDFYLPASNTLLEVHGTFWHADPRVYGNKPLTPIQARNTENDKRKAERALRDGYEFRVMWEKDIQP